MCQRNEWQPALTIINQINSEILIQKLTEQQNVQDFKLLLLPNQKKRTLITRKQNSNGKPAISLSLSLHTHVLTEKSNLIV